jgi:predicted RNase H-like HicB family nuclease
MSRNFTAIYELGDDGWWTVRIKEVPGAHTQGRSIAQARTRVREALSLFVKDAGTADFVDVIHVAASIRTALDRANAAKREASRIQQRVSRLAVEAARKLVSHMSVRDASEILGVSHQRVQQLAGSSKADRPDRPRQRPGRRRISA